MVIASRPPRSLGDLCMLSTCAGDLEALGETQKQTISDRVLCIGCTNIYISYIWNYKRYYTRYISIYIYYWDVPNELNPKCLISAGCVLSFGGALDRSTITVGTIGTLVIIEGAHDE